MQIEDIKKLMELMEAKGVIELEMENASGKLRLVREHDRTMVPASPSVIVTSSAPHPQIVTAPQPQVTTIPSAAAENGEAGQLRGVAIPSPMVGTFYRAPSPDAKPYVDTGTVVEIGDVVCIVEAMKMMNEIQAEVRGRVIKVMVENGKPVEYGQPLFLLEPL
jgi:acetyl-CoA carboxylase biotin carboxyl carrier protein